MPKTNAITKIKRLDQLVGLLKSKEIWTTHELSSHLEVSQRTLMRDLRDLKETGIPIETDRGRGGGVRINKHYGIGRINFNYGEIIDLILALSTIEKLRSPLFLNDLKSIKNKIAAAFPESQKQQVNEIRKRILIGDEASSQSMESYQRPKSKNIKSLHKSFFERSKLEITYRSEKGEKTKRIIHPELMLLNWPIWYILGWDELRSDVRNFRIDRIISCTLIDESFKPLKRIDYGNFLDSFFKSI